MTNHGREMNDSRNHKSYLMCIDYLKLGLPIFLAIICFLTCSPERCCAENSALTGLGEPASPGSMEHPMRTTPGSENDFPRGSVGPETSSIAPRIQPGTSSISTPDGHPEPVMLRQSLEHLQRKALTLHGTIDYADENYPVIIKGRSQVRAAQKTVKLQKIQEYMPESLFQFQEIMSSHNKLSQIFYGSPVFPAIAGPGVSGDSMKPLFYSGAGVNVDWAPIDFGLHKARIMLAKTEAKQAVANFNASELDVAVNAANAFLDVVVSVEQIKAAQENVRSFQKFAEVVGAQVRASLKPGADESLAEAQLANAKNDLIRANLGRDVAAASLSNAIGLGGEEVEIDSRNLATAFEAAAVQKVKPTFEQVPIFQAAKQAMETGLQQKKVLQKEYYPVFHLLGGFSVRGSGLGLNGSTSQSLGGNGVFPVVPNYQAALIINWNFLDWFRLHQEKKIQDERIIQQHQDANLVLQNLRTQDFQSRARVRAALDLAANMPVLTNSARIAARQAEARYASGLGSVAQVAEANQVLANARVQEAVAKISVWRAMLGVAAVHGDLKPFISEADRIQGAQ